MPRAQREPKDAPRIEPRYLGLGELFYRISDAVIVGEAVSGQVILWNSAATRIFGYGEREALGLRIEDLVPPALKEAHRAGLRRFADTGGGPLIDDGRTVELLSLIHI